MTLQFELVKVTKISLVLFPLYSSLTSTSKAVRRARWFRTDSKLKISLSNPTKTMSSPSSSMTNTSKVWKRARPLEPPRSVLLAFWRKTGLTPTSTTGTARSNVSCCWFSRGRRVQQRRTAVRHSHLQRAVHPRAVLQGGEVRRVRDDAGEGTGQALRWSLLDQKSFQLLRFWIWGDALQHVRRHLPRWYLGRE